MSSGSERKRELHDERLAREQQAAGLEQRRRRLLLLGASGVVAVVIAVVLIAVSQGGDDEPGGDGGAGAGGARSGAAEVERLYAGIPQRGTTLGRPDAPLRMVEFADLQCPFCAEYTRDVLPTLVRRYVREGQLRMELRPLAFLGDDSRPAAAGAAAAAVQNRIWQFTDLFFLNQGAENSGYVTADFLRRIARGAGVEPGPVLAAAQSPVAPPLLSRAANQAERLDVASTPSFFIGRGDDPLEPLEVSELEPSAFSDQLDAALEQ